jgi:hypothetical protein
MPLQSSAPASPICHFFILSASGRAILTVVNIVLDRARRHWTATRHGEGSHVARPLRTMIRVKPPPASRAIMVAIAKGE